MKILEGIIISNKMQKTAVVEVISRTPHSLYKKLIKRSKKFKVGTNGFEVSVGDRVRIVETKPISKGKNFKVKELINLTQNSKIKEEKKETEKVKETSEKQNLETQVKEKKTKEVKKVKGGKK